ncbi:MULTISPECIES: type II secretion system F family protein [Paraburkholderia]|uniref:type II secretion system F family protein n=1 Tax=Paraburkholderia TaxID=1822464 RepID=UPI0022542956|nr:MULTISPECIES: type II secretion system F family protein [Paraburkholderia]MCX4156757.1 type II secretion system F family protein [Paraburkholderia aspalathi]MDN7166162.1 type II secretion system F family protein [Paraburkholderia sp. SECH2]MDQ6394648.1 type II secretion system F family protein [Paraburkholderia aspalathi]
MSSSVLVFAALALLCAAGALLLLQRSAQRKDQMSAERFIDSRMASGTVGAGGPVASPRVAPSRAGLPLMAAPQTPQADAGWFGRVRYLKARGSFTLQHAMASAGINHARVPAILVGTFVLVLCIWAASVGGVLAAAAVLVTCGAFIYFLVTMRANKRRQQIVRQLPLFLDGIVRLITLGNSVPAAFQASLQTTEAPLRECLDHVSRMLRTGVEIDRALSHVAVIYNARELELVGAVLRLSVKYGGRADVMLDRMSSFMRDLEQAERELSAMSAETRMSSWVLGLLPVGIGGFLILSNPEYFASMWFDATGRNVVYLAFALQALGSYLLHRMARLRN